MAPCCAPCSWWSYLPRRARRRRTRRDLGRAKQASNDEKQGRGSLRLAVGGERRFRFGLAVNAELGLATIAENSKAPDAVMLSTAGQLSRYHLGGGTLMIGV